MSTAPWAKRASHIGDELRWEDGDTVLAAGYFDLDRDRQIQVASGHGEAIADQLHPHAGEHRKGAPASGDRSTGGAECFDERVAFAAELHAHGVTTSPS
jgi:hypothetical protein